MPSCDPSVVYVIGRNFKPTQDQMYAACGVLFKKYEGILTPDHFQEVNIGLRMEAAADRKAFFQVVPAKQAEYPGAHVVDLFILDEDSGKDMVIIAIWDGASAELGRQMFQKKWWQFWK